MNRQERKEAVQAYKDRKPAHGVFAVICTATGQAWVGASSHVDTQQNGLWFSLRMGGCPFGSLQSAWKEHGEREFRFEELDRLSGDFSKIGLKDELKQRQALWQTRLRAQALG